MIKLNKSGVDFDVDAHEYHLNGVKLHGITGMLSNQLFAGKYDGVPDYVLERARERGTSIHETIEMYDAGFEPADIIPELESYKRIKSDYGLKTIANEYIVTDGKYFASSIDLVFTNGGKNIILVDIKTTSKLDVEYVRWQLSVYAYLFELQNPKLKVTSLYAMWLRGDKSEYVIVDRIDNCIVQELMLCEIEGRQFINAVAPMSAKVPAEIVNAEQAVYKLITAIRDLEAKKKEITEGLHQLMKDNGIKNYKGKLVTLTRKDSYEKEDLDKERLKNKYPKIYKDCIKKTKIKESLSIKV